MDIPSYPSTSDTPTPQYPPPSYNEINALPIYEGLPAKPPPAYTEVTAPPTDTIQQHANLYPRTQAEQFPVPMAGADHRVLVHPQFVRNEAPQVIVVQPQQIVHALGDTSTATVCKFCQNSILTVVKYKPGCAAWGMCVLMSVLGLVCGFCLIPFCVRGFKDAHHYCPRCRQHIGIYRRK